MTPEVNSPDLWLPEAESLAVARRWQRSLSFNFRIFQVAQQVRLLWDLFEFSFTSGSPHANTSEEAVVRVGAKGQLCMSAQGCSVCMLYEP